MLCYQHQQDGDGTWHGGQTSQKSAMCLGWGPSHGCTRVPCLPQGSPCLPPLSADCQSQREKSGTNGHILVRGGNRLGIWPLAKVQGPEGNILTSTRVSIPELSSPVLVYRRESKVCPPERGLTRAQGSMDHQSPAE